MKKMVNGVEYEMTPEEEADFLASTVLVPLTGDTYRVAIQALVDETAREKQFNDGVTLASYAASTVEVWALQAQTFVAWRDSVWQYAYSELGRVQAGERERPTVDDFLLELPQIVWP